MRAAATFLRAACFARDVPWRRATMSALVSPSVDFATPCSRFNYVTVGRIKRKSAPVSGYMTSVICRHCGNGTERNVLVHIPQYRQI